MKILKTIALISMVFFSSCYETNENLFQNSICDQITKIDSSIFNSVQSEGFSIKSVHLNGDCMEVEIESGGCNGETWKVELLDADRVAETAIEQRDLKISLKNPELCNAIVFKTYTFDLRPVRTGKKQVILNLDLWDEQILYEY